MDIISRRQALQDSMLLIFDFDGTMADSWPWLADELVRGADRFGYRSMTRAQLEALRGMPTRRVFEALGIGDRQWPAIVSHLRERAATVATGFPLFDGIAGMLERLHRHGNVLALVSSNSEIAVRRSLGASLNGIFELHRCDVDMFDKAEAFAQVMRKAGFARQHALVIGDETRDLDAAEAAGVQSVAVTWGYADPGLLGAAAPGRTAETVNGLAAMIFNAIGAHA